MGQGTCLNLFFGPTMWHVRSQFSNQGSNLLPLQWKCRVLTTRLLPMCCSAAFQEECMNVYTPKLPSRHAQRLILSSFSEKNSMLSCVQLFVTAWPKQSMELSRLEYWSGQPFPSAGNLLNPRIEPRSPALQADSLPAKSPQMPQY